MACIEALTVWGEATSQLHLLNGAFLFRIATLAPHRLCGCTLLRKVYPAQFTPACHAALS